MPPAIQRNILEIRPGIPPTPPIKRRSVKDILEALLNFQTLVSDLTALDVANASLLDEATAAAEAMAPAHRVTKSNATAFFVDKQCLPQTIAVLKTRAEPLGWQIIVGEPFKDFDAGWFSEPFSNVRAYAAPSTTSLGSSRSCMPPRRSASLPPTL